MRRVRFLLWAAILCSAGCFPIDLHVNAKGEILILRQEGFFLFQPNSGKLAEIPTKTGGKPLFARFAPNGTDVLLISKVRQDFDDKVHFDLVPQTGGESRRLFSTRDAINVSFSPDGSQLAIVVLSGLWGDFAEIHLVDVKTGKARLAVKSAGHMIHWFADSRRLLHFSVHEKKKDGGDYLGDIAVLNTADDETTSLARAVVSKRNFLEMSPDGRRLLFTARRAGPVDTKLSFDKLPEERLFELDTAKPVVAEVTTKVKFARFSPSGKKVLLTVPSQSFVFDRCDLVVANARLGERRTLATDAADSLTGFDIALPGWLDDDTIYYFAPRLVYGDGGRALHLITIGADGKNKTFVQPDIDQAVWDLGMRK